MGSRGSEYDSSYTDVESFIGDKEVSMSAYNNVSKKAVNVTISRSEWDADPDAAKEKMIKELRRRARDKGNIPFPQKPKVHNVNYKAESNYTD